MSTIKILSVQVDESLTVKPLEDQVSRYHTSRPATILQCITESVYAIPEAAMPKQSSFHLVGNALVILCDAVLTKYEERQTNANTKTMIRNATNAELHRREASICANAMLVKATKLAADKPTKANIKKADTATEKAITLAAVPVEVSLDKAGKRGVAVAKLKSSNIKVRQVKANKAGATRSAKPTKLALAALAEKRVAAKELFLQAVDNALEVVGLGDKAKAAEIMTAFTALSASSKVIIEYLPTDMRTL